MQRQSKVEHFLGPVSDTLSNVLATMAATQASLTTTSIKETPRAKGSVTGIIPMRSATIHGSLAITFSKEALLTIYGRMLGEKPTSLDEEVSNLAGEITNMVAGGANSLYEEQGYNFEMATPFLLAGTNHAIHHDVKGGTTLLAEFKSDAGGIFVELCFAV